MLALTVILQRVRMEGRVAIGFLLSPHLYECLVYDIGWVMDDSLLTWENMPVIMEQGFGRTQLEVLTVESELAAFKFSVWEADTV